MDVAMPNMDGIDATREICTTCDLPGRTRMLSLYDVEETRKRAADAGAVAFVTKQEPDGSLLLARQASRKPRRTVVGAYCHCRGLLPEARTQRREDDL